MHNALLDRIEKELAGAGFEYLTEDRRGVTTRITFRKGDEDVTIEHITHIDGL
jgi:hypothetical protein